MKKLILSLAIALGTTICASAKDIQTIVVTTNPQMHCENCEKRIKNNLRFEKGIKKIQTDIDNQTVTITFDADKTDKNAIVEAFAKIDYQVEIVEPRKEEK